MITKSIIKKSNLFVNISNFIFFFGASLIQFLIGLYTFPIFATNLSSLDYSIIGYFTSIQQFFIPLLNMSFYSYYMMNYHKNDTHTNNNILMNLIIFLSIINILIILIGLLLLHIYFSLANVTLPFSPYSIIILSTSYFSIYQAFFLVKCKMDQKGLKYFLLSGSYSIFNIIIGLFFVVGMQWGAKGRLGATLFTSIIFGIISFKNIYKIYQFDFSIIKDAVKTCLPLMFTALLHFPLKDVDKIFLERQNDIVNFGLYNIANMVTRYFFTMGAALFQAFEPDLYLYSQQNKIKHIARTILTIFSILFLFNILFTYFSESIFSLLTNERYTDAYKYCNILIWGIYFFLLSNAFTVLLIVKKKTKNIFLNKLFVSIVSICIYLIFIAEWGFIGAAYAKVLANSILSLSLLVLITKYYRSSN